MGFFKVDTSKLNKRYGRGGSVNKSRQVTSFNTPNKNRAPDIPKTEAKEGDVLSYFDDTKGKVLTSFDGGYQSSNTAKVSDMNRFDQGQTVTTLDASRHSRVRTRGELHSAINRKTIIDVGLGNTTAEKQLKYMDYVSDSTCDTTSGSSTVNCDTTNILNGKIRTGMIVRGAGIPEYAVVKRFLSTSSFELGTISGLGIKDTPGSSVNATANGTNVTLQFYGTTLYLDGSKGGDIGTSIFIDRGNEWYENYIAGIELPDTVSGSANMGGNDELLRGGDFKIYLYFGSRDFVLSGLDLEPTVQGDATKGGATGRYYHIGGSSDAYPKFYTPYEFVDGVIKWIDFDSLNSVVDGNYGGGDVKVVELQATPSRDLRLVSATRAPNMKIGYIKHIINTPINIRYAHSGNNSVITEITNTKIPAKAIITKVVAKVTTASNLTTHAVNLQMSATSGTLTDDSISSGTELIGGDVTNTDSSDSSSASDIDLKQTGEIWLCKDTVRNGTSDQYLYICNAGTSNGTTNSTAGTMEIYIEYYK